MKSEERERLTNDVSEVTDDDVINVEGRTTTRGRVSALTVAFINLSAGVVFAYTSPALPDMMRHSFRLSPDQQVWTCTIVNLGAFLASLFCGRVAQALGRKPCLLSTVILFVFGWLLIVAADGLAMLLAGRFVTGMCLGLCFILVPGYLAEITTAKARDSIGAFSSLFLDLGLLFVHFFGMFVPWRYLALLCMVVLLATMLLLLYVPESPRWLLSRGRVEEARETLRWLRGAKEDEEVEQEFGALQRHLDRRATCYFTIRYLWAKDVRQPLLLSTILIFFWLMTGMDYVWYFTLSIFEESGVHLSPHLQTNLFALSGVIGCITSVYVLGRFGRKQVLMVTAALQAISLFALGFFFWMTRDPATAKVTREDFYWLPVTSLFVYQFSYAAGWSPLPFLIMNELLPARARHLASSLVCALTWLLVLVAVVLFVKTKQNPMLGHHGLFWMFSAFSGSAILFVAFFIPETKGKTLEEIENYFLSKH